MVAQGKMADTATLRHGINRLPVGANRAARVQRQGKFQGNLSAQRQAKCDAVSSAGTGQAFDSGISRNRIRCGRNGRAKADLRLAVRQVQVKAVAMAVETCYRPAGIQVGLSEQGWRTQLA